MKNREKVPPTHMREIGVGGTLYATVCAQLNTGKISRPNTSTASVSMDDPSVVSAGGSGGISRGAP